MTRSLVPWLALFMTLVCGCETSGGEGGEGSSIPECDKLFRVASACFAKKPEAKAAMSEGIDQVKAMLSPQGGQPLERAKIADICRERMASLQRGCN